MRSRDEKTTFGVFIYDGVEPIDIGGTSGVFSMARRVLPNILDFTLAAKPGPIRLSGGMTVLADHGVDDAPDCDVVIVCGGPGWPQAAQDAAVLRYLRDRAGHRVASVCTGALILGAAGVLEGRAATTRRTAVGVETSAPLALLKARVPSLTAREAVVVDDTVVTGGGVSLAIDATLYLLEKFYGADAANDVATVIEYDRARKANRDALGYACIASA